MKMEGDKGIGVWKGILIRERPLDAGSDIAVEIEKEKGEREGRLMSRNGKGGPILAVFHWTRERKGKENEKCNGFSGRCSFSSIILTPIFSW